MKSQLNKRETKLNTFGMPWSKDDIKNRVTVSTQIIYLYTDCISAYDTKQSDG